jgi:hypothetical protein
VKSWSTISAPVVMTGRSSRGVHLSPIPASVQTCLNIVRTFPASRAPPWQVVKTSPVSCLWWREGPGSARSSRFGEAAAADYSVIQRSP